MSEIYDRLMTVIGLCAGAWIYARSKPRSFGGVIGLVLVIAWGSRFALDVVTR